MRPIVLYNLTFAADLIISAAKALYSEGLAALDYYRELLWN